MLLKFYPLPVILLCLVHFAAAQVTGTLTIDQGLSQNYVYDILQDSKGFLWFGTKEGLNRYDGYSFVVYRNDPLDPHSLSNNTVTSLYEDSAGVLWIGTIAGGLNKFDRKTETFTRINFESDTIFQKQSERINAISPGANGILWIGTHGGGLVRFDTRTFRCERFVPNSLRRSETIPNNDISEVVESGNTTWIATAEGLGMVDLRLKTITNIFFTPHNVHDQITTIFKTSRGELLVAHRNGVDLFDGKHFLPFFTATDSNGLYWTARIREDAQGNLWFGTMRSIAKYDYVSKQISTIASIETERFTRGLYIDRSNVVWCGTTGWGAYICNQKVLRFGANEGNFLFELFRDELALINKRKDVHDKNSGINFSLRGGSFASCLRDSNGDAWLMAANKLFFYEKKTRRLKNIRTNPRQFLTMREWSTSKLYEDRKGNIWIGTVGGISKLDKRDWTFDYYRLYLDSTISENDINKTSYKDITSIIQDRNGVFWVGTPANGLFRFDPVTGSIKNYTNRALDPASLSNNYVLSICEDPVNPDSILWIGTDGGGLNRFTVRTEKFLPFTQQKDFPNNVVYGIMSDKNHFLWMSTNNGLIKMDPRNSQIIHYDIRDGLQSNEFNRNEYYKTESGKMYFGGIYGYNAFVPEEIKNNPVIPNVVLTEFSLFNKSVTQRSSQSPLTASISETKNITLEYSQNVFTLEFAALEFSAPLKNQYAYKLEGFDAEWIHLGVRRRATYTNLDPGNYIFHVKASNGDGVWNNKGTSVAITILPPFYMTWWFRGILIFLFLSTGPTIYYGRVTQLKREQQRQHEISQMLIESQEVERKRIAQEMHDSLGQELLVIKNRAVMGLKTAAEESKEKRQLEQISDGATNILKLVRAISHNLRPPELDRLGLTETIRSILSTVHEVSNVKLHGELETIDGMIKKENEINVIRILQETLSNIEKHSGASEIFIIMKLEQQHIALTIKDNGKGFTANKIKHGIGLAGISERVRILHGSLSITSAIGEGTTISITIPIHNNV